MVNASMTNRFYSRKLGLLISCLALGSLCVYLALQGRESMASSSKKTESPSEKQAVGWLELVNIYPGELNLRAKLDTGAKHSSLNATDLEFYERDGQKWVRFKVTEKKGKSVEFKEKVVRMAVIKERNGQLTERPVIKLWFCIGDKKHQSEVNLANRSIFNYQLLLGRSFLNGKYIVDVSAKFTTKPSCSEGMK